MIKLTGILAFFLICFGGPGTLAVTGTGSGTSTSFALDTTGGTGNGESAIFELDTTAETGFDTSFAFSYSEGTENTYTITANAGANGSMEPSGAVTVNHGASQSFIISANSGYHILDVTVDSGSVGAITIYNFTSVTANHTISATFEADAPKLYTLTVTNGTGDGNYATGKVLTITADSPTTGKIFDKWTGQTANLANINLANTIITMPASDVTISATYIDIPQTLYTLTVNGGTGGGQYLAGTPVSINAEVPATGKIFDKWTGDIATVSNINLANTIITMPSADSAVTASYRDIPPGIYTLTVNSGTGDGQYSPGTVVTIVANAPPAGKTFDIWTGDTGWIANVNLPSSTTTLTMPSQDVVITASYKDIPPTLYTLTVNSGTGGGQYLAGASVSISADAPATGKIFDKWTGQTANVANINLASSTINMPASDVTISATYIDIPPTLYTLTVNSGTGGGTYAPGENVTINASLPTPGKEFFYWSVSPSNNADIAEQTSPDTVAIVNGDVTVKANYMITDGAAIVLTSPNGGENLNTGGQVPVKWISSGVNVGTVKIELFRNGVFDSTITPMAENIGTYDWTIPQTQTASSNYKIKISSIDAPSVFDSSDLNFAITSQATAELTMEVQPANTGSVYPQVGVYTVNTGKMMEISAAPAEDFKFMRWKIVEGDADITEKSSANTTAILYGDSDITAIFSLDYELVGMAKVKIKLDSSGAGDSVMVSKAELPVAITAADFTPETKTAKGIFSFRLMIDDFDTELNQTTGTLKQMGKKLTYSYKPNKNSTKISLMFSLEPGKRFLSLKGSKLDMIKEIDNSDDIDLIIGIGEKLFGGNLGMDETMMWKFDSKKGDKADTLSVNDGMTMANGFSIASAAGKSLNFKENKDSFSIAKALAGNIQYVKGDIVAITLDEWMEDLTDSMVKSGEQVFKAKGTSGVLGKYSFILDLGKKVWSFKLSDAADLSDLIYENDGIDVILQVGDYEAGLRLDGNRKTSLTYPHK